MSDEQISPNIRRRRRVLFVAEAVTLAHVARPAVLAQALDTNHYEVLFACDPRFQRLLGSPSYSNHDIRSIPSQQFLDALSKGKPVYDTRTLQEYVEEDLRVLEQLKPDLVVGDFRLSLSISARIEKVPYATITNAYWSPYARRRFPLPDLPLTRLVGLPIASAIFRAFRPIAFKLHTRPLNKVRQIYVGRGHHLPAIGNDLCHAYTEADYVLYADVPGLISTGELPCNHRYLGPVLWSPKIDAPLWWNDLPADEPVVYVTLGSSGQGELLPVVLGALADVSANVIAATAGRKIPAAIPRNAFVADYLPGDAAAARASLVICNGGSPTTHQALVAGTPVLGIANNMDQHMNIEAIARAGAGLLLRSDKTNKARVRAATDKLLNEDSFTRNAQAIARNFADYNAQTRFCSFVEEFFGDQDRETKSLLP